jgi:hypothetical protein
MTTAHTTGPELTRNPQDSTWGFMCVEHRVLRSHLTEQHARNVEAKHLREHHDPMGHLAAGLTLDLTAMAIWLVDGESIEGLLAWTALTGLPTQEAVELAQWIAAAEPHITAAVTPW